MPSVSDAVGLRQELGICISKKFPGDAAAGPHFESRWHRVQASSVEI